MTLEEAKDILSFVYTEYADKSAECACKYNDFETANYFDDRCEAIDTVLRALVETENHSYYLEENRLPKDYVRENYIPKEKIREKIKEQEQRRNNCELEMIAALFERDINLLEELLGE